MFGRLVVIPDTPILEVNNPGLGATPATDDEKAILVAKGADQILELRHIKQYVYTRVTDGTLVDIARVEVTEDREYPTINFEDGGSLDLATAFVADVRVSSDSTLRSSLDIEPIPFTSNCTGSSRSACAAGVWGGLFRHQQSPGTSGFNGYVFPPGSYGDILTISQGGAAAGTLGSSAST
ncbi:hypothetical protein [Thioalkalivibrio sp. XN279]|uniref:hypothetical protein n=1 Tax=Thioalkalivibrio sp. XN279 TaxID=2714953 RepID=UPI0014081BF6|nr:hypothetical protein [Thioalkalivibrio sp. XN279]NHA15332.1 hypothetical protein [Thioalkalivibrio sp. XN279]